MNHREEVAQAERRHAAAEGHAKSLAARREDLTEQVAQSKGRLAAARRAEENAAAAIAVLLQHHDALLAELQAK